MTDKVEGYEVVDVAFSRPEWYEAFLRPRSAFGALVQLVQTPRDWSDLTTDVTVEQLLDGQVVWGPDSTPVLRTAPSSPAHDSPEPA